MKKQLRFFILSVAAEVDEVDCHGMTALEWAGDQLGEAIANCTTARPAAGP